MHKLISLSLGEHLGWGILAPLCTCARCFSFAFILQVHQVSLLGPIPAAGKASFFSEVSDYDVGLVDLRLFSYSSWKTWISDPDLILHWMKCTVK